MFQLTPEGIAMGLTYYVVLLFSLSCHEAAHAWTARRLGDDTAEREGRISLNPMVHIDPIGTVLIPLIQIFWGGLLLGWAKPTPYNPGNFRRQTSLAQGHMLVAAAGPVSNLILALGFTGLLFVALQAGLDTRHPAVMILAVGVSINVVLALFNLVPLPPLDGSKVASWGLPRPLGMRYDAIMEPYGMWMLLILFATGILGALISPVYRTLVHFLYGLAS